MITFACKKIKPDELIRCSFEINKTEYNVLFFMIKNKSPITVIRIAEKMELERTTVQKAIKTLLEKNLVRRIQRNLQKGGYVFFYEVENKKDLKARITKIVHAWVRAVDREIEKL